ncbi:MAG TPA: flagellar hook-basal body complex protein [Ferrovibrio sp.]|jgi:flagellar hook protein FlgE|uniref:flagellar hook protein FlgE n=1 Tax=Ferrovibrio sp. TaxID=1917215 RepID=UPI002ED4C8E0
MSGFGSFDTALLGLTAQTIAIGHISDNVANAGTNGYKQVDTAFSDLVFTKLQGAGGNSDATRNMGVSAIPDFANRRQGTIIHDDSLTSIAVNGAGFIPVAKPTGFNAADGTPSGFEDTTYYTRLGDFRLDNSNRLVNSAGYYLQAAAVNGTTPGDFVIDDSDIAAVPTSTISYKINLPASANTGTTVANGIGLIDANSVQQDFGVTWTKTAADTWDLTINTAGGTPSSFGPVTVTFANGVLASMTTADPNLTVSGAGAATIGFSPDFGAGAQAITLDLGTYGSVFSTDSTSGLTQYASQTSAATNFDISQNGLLSGQFTNVSFDEDGQIIYNYTNARSQVGGQILLANFPEPDRLDRVDGTAYRGTTVAGDVVYGIPGDPTGTTGLGHIVASSLEQSNVDVAEQMTRLIVAQQAYGMNSQVIKASDDMLSRAIDMKR